MASSPPLPLPLPGSPAKAAGTLAGQVAELPSLEVETRQLGGSGQTGGCARLEGWRRRRSRWLGSLGL